MNPNIEQIHKYNHIHPTAVIDDMVEMGEGNYVGPFCYLAGYLQIGNKNRFESHCAVGTRQNTLILTDLVFAGLEMIIGYESLLLYILVQKTLQL